MSLESPNVYTKSAIKALQLMQTDPKHESIYAQRAAAYAAVAQAIELEEINTIVGTSTSIVAEMSFELTRIKKALFAMLPDDAPGIV